MSPPLSPCEKRESPLLKSSIVEIKDMVVNSTSDRCLNKEQF